MNICGCVVHIKPERIAEAETSMASTEGVEVHAKSDDGRLVIVVEDTETRLASEIIMDLHQVPGVISLTLTYHHFEDETAIPRAPLAQSTSTPIGAQFHDQI